MLHNDVKDHYLLFLFSLLFFKKSAEQVNGISATIPVNKQDVIECPR